MRNNLKELSSRQLGFDSDYPIYINQSLTEHRRKLFILARRYKGRVGEAAVDGWGSIANADIELANPS